MSVYFIEAGDLIKIGFSANVKARVSGVMRDVSQGGTMPTAYLGHMPGDREMERFLHARFAEHRAYGEWFKRNTKLVSFIEDMADKDYPQAEPLGYGEQVHRQDDILAEQSAEALHRAVRGTDQAAEETLARISAWSGIDLDRLKDIYAGNVRAVTAGEFTICWSLEEASKSKDAA